MRARHRLLRDRLRPGSDDGVYAIEMLGLFVLFTAIVIAAFQLAAIGGAANMAENAARAGSRAATLGVNPRTAALGALDPGTRDRASVGGGSCNSPSIGQTVTVCIDVPVVIPLVDLDIMRVTRQATLPARGLGRG